jgi:hypothetical protein
MDGWAPGEVQTIRRKRKLLTPHCGSNPAVHPVASHYTMYALPLPAIQREMVCLWHTTGEEIMKIMFHM